MATIKFTKTELERLEPGPNGKMKVYFDSGCPGFGVRVMRGTKPGSPVTRTLFVQLRVGVGKDAPQRNVKLGRVQDIIKASDDVNTWRAVASTKIAEAKLGIDPRIVKKTDEMPTFEAFGARYLREYAEKKHVDKGRRARRAIALASKVFGDRPLNAVNKADIRGLHLDLADKERAGPGKIAANKTLALLSTLFRYAVDAKLIGENDVPTRGIKHLPSDPRTVVLDDDEAARYLAVLGDIARAAGVNDETPSRADIADALRLLLMTGQRYGEVVAMTWPEIDLARGQWRREAGRNKNRHQSVTWLGAGVVAVLTGIRARRDAHPLKWVREAQFVFPSRRSKKLGYLTALRPLHVEALAAAKIDKPIRIHDLRSAFASTLIADGMPLSQVAKLTGHKNLQTLQRHYDRLQSENPLLAGLERMEERWKLP